MVAENVILIVLAIILFSNSTHYDFISAAKVFVSWWSLYLSKETTMKGRGISTGTP